MNAFQERRSFIFLAEDNPKDVSLVKLALHEHGVKHTLLTMEDGEQALQYIDGLETEETGTIPDLLMLDLNLPKIGGYSILTRVRESRRSHSIPVLIVTSSDSMEDQNMANLQGAHYFQKVADLDGYMKLGGLVKDILALRPSSTTGNLASTGSCVIAAKA